jgi:hypothetical protein
MNFMKNKLITAFLTLVTIGSFAQQPSNAELLKKLQSKKRSLQINKKFWTFAEKTYQWWYKEDFAFPARLFQEIYESQGDTSHKIGQSRDAYFYFAPDYYRPENWTSVPYEPSEKDGLFLVLLSKLGALEHVLGPRMFMTRNPEIFKKEFIKHHEEYCIKNPNGRWKNLNHDEFIHKAKYLPIFTAAHRIIYKKNNIEEDIQKINVKIKDLKP